MPIVGIRRGIASPGLVKTFCFRISHRVIARRGRYAIAFWSCRRQFRDGVIVRYPSEPLRQKWILRSKNSLRAYFSVLYPSNPEGSRDIEFSLVKFGDKNVTLFQMTGLLSESQRT